MNPDGLGERESCHALLAPSWITTPKSQKIIRSGFVELVCEKADLSVSFDFEPSLAPCESSRLICTSLPRGQWVGFMLQEPSLAFNTAAVSGQRAVCTDDSMTRNDDPDGV
jgi:hypothetical protein